MESGTDTPFGWRLAHRPDVRFGHAAGGAAGILSAAAVFAFFLAVTGDDARLPGVGFHLALVVVALAVGWKVRGPVRSAAVAAIAVAVPLVWLFAVIGDRGAADRSDYRLILLLSIATYAALYLLTWTRGRAVLLGLALLFAASWVVFEVAQQPAPLPAEVASQAQVGGVDDPGGLLEADDRSTEAAIANLAVAVVVLGAGVVLDRRGRAGAATPCLLVGGIYAVTAALTWGVEVDDVYATGAFVVVAGLAIGLAGSLGRRRGTSWIGAAVLLVGVVTIVAQGTTDAASGGGDAAAWRFGAFALVGAAVLLGAGILVARSLDEPVDGGEPGPPAPRPVAPSGPAPDVGPGVGPDVEPACAAAATAPTTTTTATAVPTAAPQPPPAAPPTPTPTPGEPGAPEGTAPPPVTWSAPSPPGGPTPPPDDTAAGDDASTRDDGPTSG